jgi:hypothetical protein
VAKKKTGPEKGRLILINQSQKEWITNEYKTTPINELTENFNLVHKASLTKSQIKSFISRHKIISGRSGKILKGTKPWNAGKKGWQAGGRSAETRFKKGHSGNEMRPVGATRICSKDGYVIIKTAMPNVWQSAHVVEWEKHSGKVPAGHALWFKDNDVTNWHIDNLILTTKGQKAIINKMKLGKVPAELKASALALAELTMMQTIKAGEL